MLFVLVEPALLLVVLEAGAVRDEAGLADGAAGAVAVPSWAKGWPPRVVVMPDVVGKAPGIAANWLSSLIKMTHLLGCVLCKKFT